MKKRTVLIRGIVGLAMLVAGITQAENLFPAQDYGKLNSEGAPEGWQMNGKYEFKKLEDPEIQTGFSVTAKEMGSVNAISPKFAVVGGKSYVLTLEFRSNRFGKTGYDKTSSYLLVRFLNADGTATLSDAYCGSVGLHLAQIMNFPYTSVAIWTKQSFSFTVPKGSVNAILNISMSNSKANDALPEIQIGNIAIQELPGDPAQANILQIPIASLGLGPAAVDAKTQNASVPGVQYPEGGDSLLITKKDVKGLICSGPNTKMPSGIYELCVRLKVSDKNSETPVFAVKLEGATDSGLLDISGKDFKKADEFQEFKFRFLKISDAGLNLPCYKAAACIVTIDTLTVSPVKQFTPDELKSYFLAK